VVRIIVAVEDSPNDAPQTPSPLQGNVSPGRLRAPSSPALAGAAAPSEHQRLVEFYDESYARKGAEAQLYADWRALGAKGKADHIVRLCRQAGIHPTKILDVGCGDGALLSELRHRRFGQTLEGVEITEAAVRIAGDRAEIDSVRWYDGACLELPDGAFDLGIVSHVLEHVPDPAALLAEVGRACKAVVMEVPLEANMSARRESKREHAEEVGHLQRLDRGAAREIVGRAGMRVAGELEDALPLAAQRFFARAPAQKAAATVKWGARTGLHLLAPPLARRLFTVHYACLCLPR
jgi:SAM-dependent methyltransferase